MGSNSLYHVHGSGATVCDDFLRDAVVVWYWVINCTTFSFWQLEDIGESEAKNWGCYRCSCIAHFLNGISGRISLSFTTSVTNQSIYKAVFAASSIVSTASLLCSNVSAAQELRRDNARDSTQHASAGFTSSSLLSSVGARSIFDWPYRGRLSRVKGEEEGE